VDTVDANGATSEDRLRANAGVLRLRAAVAARVEGGTKDTVDAHANGPTSEDRLRANAGIWRLRAAVAARGESGAAHAIHEIYQAGRVQSQ